MARLRVENRLEFESDPPSPFFLLSSPVVFRTRRARNTEARNVVTGNSIRIRWRLKGEKTKARERERKRRKKKKKKEPHTGGEKTGGGEKKGWRHPLGSREATQEANSPITCRTYRGFAIQASPSNTINIPSRMPGIHAAAESSICDGQRENDGRWKEGCGRRAGMEADSSSSSFAGDTNYATKLFHPIAKRGYRRSQNIFMEWNMAKGAVEAKYTEFRNSSGKRCALVPPPSPPPSLRSWNPISQFPLPFFRVRLEQEKEEQFVKFLILLRSEFLEFDIPRFKGDGWL